MSLPVIQMEGRLTSDPGIRFTPNGKAVTNFTVACNDRVPDGHGGWKDGATCFLRVSLWNRAAEGALETLKQGDLVLVTGRLEQQEWEKDGQKRTSYQVSAATVGKVTIAGPGSPPAGRDSDRVTDAWGSPAPVAEGSQGDPPF